MKKLSKAIVMLVVLAMLTVSMAVFASCEFVEPDSTGNSTTDSVDTGSTDSGTSDSGSVDDGGNETPVVVTLTAPVLEVDSDENISWTAVENATGYVVNLNGTDLSTQQETSFPAKTEEGTYTVKVKAIGDGELYLDSEYSVEYTYEVVALETYTVTKATSDAYTIVGDDTATEGYDYTFTVSINTTYYEGEYTVIVNGEAVTAEDGIYTVANVNGNISIDVTGLTQKTVSITSNEVEGLTFVGESTVVSGTDYTFEIEVEDGYMGLVFFKGEMLTANAEGKYALGALTADVEIVLYSISEDVMFIPQSFATVNKVTEKVDATHCENGEVITGTNIANSAGSIWEKFTFNNTDALIDGENTILRMIGPGNYSLYIVEVSMTDAITGYKLVFTLYSGKYLGKDCPNAFVRVEVRDLAGERAFYHQKEDDCVSNFNNVYMGEAGAYKRTPEVKFNTQTGVVTYAGLAICTVDLSVFGYENNESFGSEGVTTTVGLYGSDATSNITIDTFLNVDMVKKYNVTKAEGEGYTVVGADKAAPGKNYTFTVNFDPAYTNGTVTVNGTTVEAVDGVYTVENVTEDLTIGVSNVELKKKYNVTYNETANSSFAGATEIAAGDEYSFEVTFNNGAKGVVYVNGELASVGENGKYNLGVVAGDVEVYILELAGNDFYTATKAGLAQITKNVETAHIETGEAVVGTQIINNAGATWQYFNYASKPVLANGDNQLVKFISAQSETSTLRIFELKLIDANTGYALVFDIYSGFFMSANCPNAHVRASIYNLAGERINYWQVEDGYQSNMNNIYMDGISAAAYNKVPDLYFNPVTGVVTYCGVTICTVDTSLFGLKEGEYFGSNGVSVIAGVYGYASVTTGGVIIDTIFGSQYAARHNVSISESESYTVSGASQVLGGKNYTFTVNVSNGYEGTPVVTVNGTTVEAVDGVYTVENVTEDLTITVSGLTLKVTNNIVTVVKPENVTFTGDSEVAPADDYTFTLTVPENYTATVYANSAVVAVGASGDYNIGKLAGDTEIKVVIYHTVTGTNGLVTNGCSTTHVETGEVVSGTRVMNSAANTWEYFDYAGSPTLVNGDNNIIKFIGAVSGNSATRIASVALYDARSDYHILFTMYSGYFLSQNCPNTTVRVNVYKGTEKISQVQVEDGSMSNFNNIAKDGVEKVTYNKVPELIFNPVTGAVTFCGVTITTIDMSIFGLAEGEYFGSNGVTVQLGIYGVNTNSGIIVDVLCNEKRN